MSTGWGGAGQGVLLLPLSSSHPLSPPHSPFRLGRDGDGESPLEKTTAKKLPLRRFSSSAALSQGFSTADVSGLRRRMHRIRSRAAASPLEGGPSEVLPFSLSSSLLLLPCRSLADITR
ncbi:hypothetical protein B296_00028661 [Ensete ventricosum]|uniref:Uncharacterized protein n=1 Tax=Ensete ventricosum TaxID=4639 RepID=A0A426YW13_ENSVE|nr:hypothetical protein B296_00028661 [Ensete ventricosum]